jgi:glycosyltransferase involved in cell wall biosynthesis
VEVILGLKLSIITPFYNTDIKLFSKYFESLSTQNYKNIEVLLINDCSTDNKTLDYAKSWCKKDNRFKIIDMPENSRTYLARVEGLKNITGDYVTFIDSDDYVTPGYYEFLIKQLEDNNVDISYGSERSLWIDSNVLEKTSDFCLTKFDSSFFKTEIFNIINSVYKREVINRAFDDICKVKRKTFYCDDILMGFIIQQHANSIINNPSMANEEFRFYIKTLQTVSSPQDMNYNQMKQFIDDAEYNIIDLQNMNLPVTNFVGVLEQKIGSPYFSKKLNDKEKIELSNYAKSKVDRYKEYIKLPKIINYIWLSNDKKPENIERWMAKNFNLNFLNNGGIELLIWKLKDFPEKVRNNIWFKKAFAVKNWAACSDYLRLAIIYNNGGFHFDADIEPIKPLPNDWRYTDKLYLGLQYDGYLECGVFGAPPGNKHIKKLLDWYENVNDFNPDWMVLGKSKTLPAPLDKARLPIYTAPNLWTILLSEEIKNKEIELLLPDVFSANDYTNKKIMATKNTITVHHFEGSWLERKKFSLNEFGLK